MSSHFDVLVIGSSWGGIEAVRRLLRGVDYGFPLPVVWVQHLGARGIESLLSLFRQQLALKVTIPVDKEPLLPGHLYVAPPGFHLLIEPDRTLTLSVHAPVNYSRPSISELFMSAGESLGAGVLAILLTGANGDGADGLRYIRQRGGMTLVEDPATAEAPAMPQAALNLCAEHSVMSLEQLNLFLRETLV